jgi:hypothetical protein
MTKTKKRETRFDRVKEHLAEINPEALLADGLETALVGYATVSNRTVACYDWDLAIRAFMKQGMTEEEAIEFYEYNTVRSLPYMGENAPIFMTRMQ